MTIRGLNEADLPAVVRRLYAEFPHDGMTHENIAHQIWADDHYEPGLNLGYWDDQGVLRGVLLGVARSGRAWIKVLTIGPDRAVPELLLEAFEGNLRRLLVATIDVAGSAPFYFLPGVDPSDTRTTLFYLGHGFRKVGEAFNMVCDLVDQPLDTAAEEVELQRHGYRVARLTGADAPALTEFVDRRFTPGWTTEALHALVNEPTTCHVAWFGGQAVGFCATEVTSPGWLGPMGTHARHRKHGLGSVLLRRGLADLRDLGYREATIGWVGPLGFYARHCQARVSRTFWQYRKELGTI